MKKTILIMMLILFLPLAYSISGGETWRYHFYECDKLRVNITADYIEEGEYTILNDCIEDETNYYICDCYDGYYFNISFEVNTVNHYTLYFNYDYSKTVKEKQISGGGSSGAFTIRFQENQSRILMLIQNVQSRFWVNGIQHTIKIINISNNTVELEIKSEPIKIILNLNESRQVQIDNETLELTLKEIRGRVVFIEFEKLSFYVETDEQIIEEEQIGEDKDENGCLGAEGYTWNETRKECVRELSYEVQEIEEPQGEVTIEFPEGEGTISDSKEENNDRWWIAVVAISLISIVWTIIYFISKKKKKAEEKYSYKRVD